MDEIHGNNSGGPVGPVAGGGGEPLPRAALLRAAADGELSDAQQQALASTSASASDDASRMAFERGLKEAVGRVMGAAAAPGTNEVLRRRIIAALGATETPAEPGTPAAHPLRASRAGRWAIAGRFAAVAAVLALATGVLVSGWRLVGGEESDVPAEQASRLVTFLTQEHDAYVQGSDGIKGKLTACTPDAAAAEAARILNRVPEAVRPSAAVLARAGYHFAGLGRCAVPGEGPSAHLVFEPDRPGGKAISLFIQVDKGCLCVPCGRCFTEKKCGVRLWKDSEQGLVYYLVAPDEAAQRAAQTLFHPPSEERPLG